MNVNPDLIQEVLLDAPIGCVSCRKTDAVLNKYLLCFKCAGMKSASDYKNKALFGQPDGLPTFSFEFETDYPDDEDRGYDDDDDDNRCNCYGCRRRRTTRGNADVLSFDALSTVMDELGFLDTYDSTVEKEYKSPIYHDYNAFHIAVKELDQFKDYVTESCGTHIHVGVTDQCSFYAISASRDPFHDLEQHMDNRRNETIEVWGRYFNSWAGRGHNEGNWVHARDNAQPTIEWRLPRFTGETQFKQLVKFVRENTAWLDFELSGRGYKSRSEAAYTRFSEKLLANYLMMVG